VNAVLWLRGEEEFVVDRSDGYIGVLVDDLVHGEHEEPYRMFTSRAEHRLLLGIDSARERLMARGVAMGLVPERAFHVQQRRWERRRKARAALGSERLNPDASTRELVNTVAGISLRAPATWAQVLQRQDVDAAQVAAAIPALSGLDDEDRRVVVAQLRYEGYLVRLQRERERTQRLRHVAIPQELDLESIPGLSREVVERLQCERPRTIADVERLPGVTPAAVALIAGRVAAHTRARRV
jgi:tRNA uridine 5-carboxymethylaminomethyl modification enzyme